MADFECFVRTPRSKSRNIIGPRWVITWKIVDGAVGIKCRLTARGLKGLQQELETFAGTTLRHGQRIVNAVAAGHGDFVLFLFDVPQASAEGMAFVELAKLTGLELREVQFDIPKADIIVLQRLQSFRNFNLAVETLEMTKPIYGPKDAPRAWRQKLHQVLVAWSGGTQPYAEPELYCTHGILLSKVGGLNNEAPYSWWSGIQSEAWSTSCRCKRCSGIPWDARTI